MFKRLFAATITGLALMAAPAVQAIPYVSGSFAFNGFTPVTTDVNTTLNFTLSPASILTGSPTGDMAAVGSQLPASIAMAAANFGSPGSFTFSIINFGTFVADVSITALPSAVNTASWDVRGHFTVGTGWSNAGAVLTANETWSLTQTGGPGSAISIGGTFFAPAAPLRVPEPGIIALMGLGLAGMGLIRRRRNGQSA